MTRRMTRSLAGRVNVLDDRHPSAATMRPMALVRAELGFVVPVESVGERGGRRLHAPSLGQGLGASGHPFG
jgi:hypothetical protein